MLIKFWFSVLSFGVFSCYHKRGLFLPFINAEEQKRKTKKEFYFHRFALPKFGVKKDNI